MKRIFIGFLLLVACLTLIVCSPQTVAPVPETDETMLPADQATATIFGPSRLFTLENAEGAIYKNSNDDHGDMKTYDIRHMIPTDVMILTDASDYFVYRSDSAEDTYLDISTWREDGENYNYRVEGTGIQEVTMGIDGLFVVGESIDCRLDAFVFEEFDHSITLYCKGDQISLIPDGELLYIEGVEEELEITLTRGFGTSKRCAITIPGGSGILDVSSMIADEITVIAEDGTRTDYHVFFH